MASRGGRPVAEWNGTRGAAWVLGLGGLVPFVALAILTLVAPQGPVPPDLLTLMISGYAAVILSFLGGIRWGAVLPQSRDGAATLALSVVPSLLAWAFLLVPVPARFACFAAAFLVQGVIDVAAARRGALPAWFGALRTVLTVGAAGSMAAAFLAAR